VGHRYYLH